MIRQTIISLLVSFFDLGMEFTSYAYMSARSEEVDIPSNSRNLDIDPSPLPSILSYYQPHKEQQSLIDIVPCFSLSAELVVLDPGGVRREVGRMR
jgi:hypothetical protein